MIKQCIATYIEQRTIIQQGLIPLNKQSSALHTGLMYYNANSVNVEKGRLVFKKGRCVVFVYYMNMQRKYVWWQKTIIPFVSCKGRVGEIELEM